MSDKESTRFESVKNGTVMHVTDERGAEYEFAVCHICKGPGPEGHCELCGTLTCSDCMHRPYGHLDPNAKMTCDNCIEGQKSNGL